VRWCIGNCYQKNNDRDAALMKETGQRCCSKEGERHGPQLVCTSNLSQALSTCQLATKNNNHTTTLMTMRMLLLLFQKETGQRCAARFKTVVPLCPSGTQLNIKTIDMTCRNRETWHLPMIDATRTNERCKIIEDGMMQNRRRQCDAKS
jgi:hypothetical protein